MEPATSSFLYWAPVILSGSASKERDRPMRKCREARTMKKGETLYSADHGR